MARCCSGTSSDGLLHFAGSVGTGFDEKELDRVAKILRKLAAPAKPFAGAVSVAEKPHWVKPELVVQVRFTEWTNEGLLRQPVYLGVREDKSAKEFGRKSREVRVN